MASNNLLVTLTIAAKDKTAKALGKISKGFRDIGKSVLSLKGALAGLAGGLLFKSAVSSAADFEEALDKIRAASGAVDSEMARITAKAEELGGSTRYTATEVAEGLNVLAKAGQTVDEQLLSISHVLSLAQGQGKSLDETAGFLVTTLNGLGLAASEVGRVTDVMAKGASSAYLDITELGETIKYSAAEARNAGLSLEQYVALQVKLAQSGVKASAAGTGLTEVLKQLKFSTTNFRTALAGLGDSSGGIISAIDTMHKAGPKASAALKALGANSRIMDILMQGGKESIDAYVDGLTNIPDVAAKAAAVMDSNLIGAMAGLGSAWDAVRRSLVTPLLGPMTDAARGLATTFQDMVSSGTLNRWSESLVNGFNGASESVKAFIREFNFQKMSDDFSEFAKNVGDNLSGISTFFTATAGVVKVFANTFSGAIKGAAAGITGYFATIASAGESVTGVLNKIGLIPDTWQDKISHGTGAIEAISEAMANGVKEDIGDIQNAFDGMANSTEGTASGLNRIAEASTNTADTVKNELVPALTAAEQAAKKSAEADKRAAEEKQKGVNAYVDALNKLGVKSAEAWGNEVKIARAALDEVKSNTNSAMDDVRAAYLEYSKTILAANESSTISVRKLRQEELRTEAALLGIGGRIEKMIKRSERGVKDFITLDGQFEQQGIKTKKALEDELQAAEDLFDQVKEQGGAVEDIGAAYENLQAKAKAAGKAESEVFDTIGESASKANAKIRSEVEQTDDKTKKLSESQKEYGESAEEAGEKDVEAKEKATASTQSMGDAIAGVLGGVQSHLSTLSDASVQTFQDMVNGITEAGVAMRDQAGNVDGSVQDMSRALSQNEADIQKLSSAIHGSDIAEGFERWVWGVQRAGAEIKESFLQQKISAERLALSLEKTAESGEVNLQIIANAARRAENDFHLLDDQDLAHLRQSITAAEQKLNDLNSAAQTAVESLADLNQQQEASLLRLQGKEEELQRLQHQEQLDRIAELELTGGAAAEREAAKARELANRLHAEELARIKERKSTDDESRTSRRRDRTNGQRKQRSDDISTQKSDTNIFVNTVYGDDRTKDAFARDMSKRINRINGFSA